MLHTRRGCEQLTSPRIHSAFTPTSAQHSARCDTLTTAHIHVQLSSTFNCITLTTLLLFCHHSNHSITEARSSLSHSLPSVFSSRTLVATMRAFTLVLLLALFAYASAVPIPFTSCGSSSDDGTISSIVGNEFPPVKGDTLQLNVTGNLTKEVTSGTYTIKITVDGFPLTGPTGSVSDFRPLPWPVGDLNFTYSESIPSVAPSGSYVISISAVDQDSDEIFCISLSFDLSEESQQTGHSLRRFMRDTRREMTRQALLPPMSTRMSMNMGQRKK